MSKIVNINTRITFSIIGFILVIIGLLGFLEITNTLGFLLGISGVYLIIDGAVSIIIQIKETFLFMIGRIIRIFIGIFIIFIVYNFDIDFTTIPLDVNITYVMILTIGIILVSYGIFIKSGIPERRRMRSSERTRR